MNFEVSHIVAKATKLQSLRSRAKEKGIADYACEVGHGRGSRRYVWHYHGSRETAHLLADECAAIAIATEDDRIRDECTRARAQILAELARDAAPSTGMHFGG